MKVKCVDPLGVGINLTYLKEYEVLNETSERYDILDDNGEHIGYYKKRFEIIKEDKMEEVRVVRKLEDLDGLENGMGAELIYVVVGGLVKVVTSEDELTINSSNEYSDTKSFLDTLKAMGFKFKYKPLRTIDQVKTEMLLKCKEFKFNSKNYFIKYIQQDKRYYVTYDCFNNILGALYFDKETANEYCNELNEILKNK